MNDKYDIDEVYKRTQVDTNPNHAFHSGQGDLLKERAQQVDHITEIGVNIGASTRAFLAGRPKKMIGIDIKDFGPSTQFLKDLAEHNGIEYVYYKMDSLAAPLEKTDILLMDGNHSYEYVTAEFKRYAPYVRKWIFLHDTNAEGRKSPTGKPYAVRKATEDFLNITDEWEIEVDDKRLAGLLILKRIKG